MNRRTYWLEHVRVKIASIIGEAVPAPVGFEVMTTWRSHVENLFSLKSAKNN